MPYERGAYSVRVCVFREDWDGLSISRFCALFPARALAWKRLCDTTACFWHLALAWSLVLMLAYRAFAGFNGAVGRFCFPRMVNTSGTPPPVVCFCACNRLLCRASLVFPLVPFFMFSLSWVFSCCDFLCLFFVVVFIVFCFFVFFCTDTGRIRHPDHTDGA